MMKGGKLRAVVTLSLRYLGSRRFATVVSVLAIAISLLFVVGVGVVNFAVKKTAVEGSIRYPLVVGPSGASGVQLILSTIFYIDKPAGTIPFSVYEELKKDQRVVAAYPVAVADSYQNVRIIGTDAAFLHDLGVGAAAGSLELSAVDDAVFGYRAALRTGVKLSDRFHGQHGMVGAADAHEHQELQYRVAGVLNPTGGPEDNAIYTQYQSVWHIHEKHMASQDHDSEHEDGRAEHAEDAEHAEHAEHEGEHDEHAQHHHDKYMLSTNTLTAVLVRTANPVFTGMLEREYTLKEGTLAVDTGKSTRDFVAHLNKGEVFVELMSMAMLVIAVIMILVTLVMSLNERRREMALMRSLGIGRFTISLTVMVEALVLTVLGVGFGLLAGHGLTWWLAPLIKARAGVDVEPFVLTSMEAWGVAIALLAGQVLALVSMVWTYRMNLVEEIARQ